MRLVANPDLRDRSRFATSNTEWTLTLQTIGNNLDAACICANTSFLAGIACCLSTACSAADQTVAVQFAQNLCKANGVTNLPSAVVCASTAASSATGVASAATTAATTAAKTTASVASNGTVSTGSLSTPIGSVTSSRTSSSSAAASATKNAALAQNVAGMGAGIAGGIAAIVALL
jgi:hypothetical protein